MASFAMLGISAAVNALAFSGTNYMFSKLNDHGSEERKRVNKAREKLERAEIQWGRDRQKKLDFYNQFLRQENKASSDINDIHQAAALNYQSTSQKQEAFPDRPVLSDFYHPSEEQKTGELIFIFGALTVGGYLVYKYLK